MYKQIQLKENIVFAKRMDFPACFHDIMGLLHMLVSQFSHVNFKILQIFYTSHTNQGISGIISSTFANA